MKVTLYKTLDLYPIGDIAFAWDNKCRRKGKRILMRDIHILCETRLSIDVEVENQLMKQMKEVGTDLLTDGRDFYSTFGGAIQQIKHPQFIKELELHKELNV